MHFVYYIITSLFITTHLEWQWWCAPEMWLCVFFNKDFYSLLQAVFTVKYYSSLYSITNIVNIHTSLQAYIFQYVCISIYFYILLLLLWAGGQAVMGKCAGLVLCLFLLSGYPSFFFLFFFITDANYPWCNVSLPADTEPYHITAIMKMFLFLCTPQTINCL